MPSSILYLALLTLLGTVSHAALEIQDLHNELKHLRDSSKTGVLTFTDTQLKKFGTGRSRPYSLVVFLNAHQVANNPGLAMPALKQEFVLAAQAVRKGPAPDSSFFVEVFFEDSNAIFKAVGAMQVPYIFIVPGTRKIVLTDFPIDNSDKMTFQTAGSETYPWKAEQILEYFKPAGLQAGEVVRPNFFKSPMFPALVAGALAGVLGVGYVLLKSGALFHPLPWALGSIAIFWFSVSGGMYNIIRGMPLFMRDNNGRLQFFLNSRNGQLGAEGFIVGTGYVLFSISVSLVTYAVPCVKRPGPRILLSYALVAASAYLLFNLFVVFQGKTGYRISSYLAK